MVTSRHTSPAILAAALIAGSVFLLQDSGFFDGAFRTDILASVKAGDSLNRSNVQALGGPATRPADRSAEDRRRPLTTLSRD